MPVDYEACLNDPLPKLASKLLEANMIETFKCKHVRIIICHA